MFYGKLADRVRYFKEDAKGVESMCKAIEEMRNQEREEVTREFVAVSYTHLTLPTTSRV